MNYNILLTADASVIAACLLAAIIAVVSVMIIIRSLKNKQGEEAVKEFLTNIQNSVLNVITDFLKTADFTAIFASTDSLLDAETEIVEKIYEAIKNTCFEKLDEQYKDDPLYNLMSNILTFEQIEGFCKKIVESEKISDMINDIIGIEAQKQIAKTKQLEAEYEKINNEIENDTYAKPGEEVPEMDPDTALGPDPWELNPPTEEGSNDVDEVVKEWKEEYDSASELIDNL